MIWLNHHGFRMNPIALSIKHPPETIVYLLGDQTHILDHTMEVSGMKKGGGITKAVAFYIPSISH